MFTYCLFLMLRISYYLLQHLKFLLNLLFRKLIQDGRPFGTTFDSGMILYLLYRKKIKIFNAILSSDVILCNLYGT